ncbi:MAG TPA: hypothetical protein VF210_18225 [Pseudomonadales bacterium]
MSGRLRLIAVATAVLTALAGCAGTGAVRQNPDGTLSIDCAGGYHDWSRCHARAADACGRAGYEIVARLSNEGSSGVGVRDWSVGGSEVARTLVVRCR